MPETWIKIEDIKDGMKLAGSIEDEMGRVLLREGHDLVRSYVARLKKMGVHEVLVDLQDSEEPVQRPSQAVACRDPETWRRIKARLSKRFEPHLDNAIMSMIHAVAARKLLKGMDPDK